MISPSLPPGPCAKPPATIQAAPGVRQEPYKGSQSAAAKKAADLGPQKQQTTSGKFEATVSCRRTLIGPSMPPADSAAHLIAKGSCKSFVDAHPTANAVNSSIVLACRRGELPERGWASKWNSQTKKAALVSALESAQMHVVYAIRPRSSTFQEDVGAASLDQVELDRLLKGHAAGKLRSSSGKAAEIISWLIEEGASIEALCADDDHATRMAAANLIAGLGNESQQRAADLLSSTNWRVRATASEALGRLGKDASMYADALARLLEDDEALVRMAATSSLRKLGCVVAGPCAQLLKSVRPRAREAALEVLASLGSSATQHCRDIAALLEDRDWQGPSAAANALQSIGADAAEHCANVLAACEPQARSVTADALARIGGEAAGKAAADLLSSREAEVRKHALEVLTSIGAPVATQYATAISDLRSDSNKQVRLAAQHAVFKLGVRPKLPEINGDGDALPDVRSQRAERRQSDPPRQRDHESVECRCHSRSRSNGGRSSRRCERSRSDERGRKKHRRQRSSRSPSHNPSRKHNQERQKRRQV